MKDYKVIVIDAIISAGKSTLIDLIKRKLSLKYNIIIVDEPVHKWTKSGLLKKFYGDKKRWGYHFQTKVFHDRIMEAILQYNLYLQNEKQEKPTLFILERSCLTDKLFMELLFDDGDITDMEYSDYKEWCDLWQILMPFKFDLFIYLRPSIEECMRRVKERARDGEEGVSLEYQQKLMVKHDKFFSQDGVTLGNDKKILVKILKTDDNFKNDPIIQDKIIDIFISYLNEI